MPNDSSTLCKQGAGVLILGALMAGAVIPAQAAVVISGAATNNISCSAGVCAPTATDAVLNVGDLETLLASGNVEVTTTGSGVQANDVAVKAALSWSTSSALTLDADRSIAIDEPVSVAGTGGLSLADDGQVGALSFGKGGHVTFANLSGSLSINGTAYTLVNTLPSLASAIANNPSGAYALAASYDAGQDGIYSESPIATTFTGNFEGLGNAVSNLFINDLNPGNNIGLFAETGTGAAISDFHLVKEEIRSLITTTGGLVGLNQGVVYDASTSGSLKMPRDHANAYANLGGLVGVNEGGSVISSNSSAHLHGTDAAAAVGGLIGGVGGGEVEYSYATGSISAGNSGLSDLSAGGLIGFVEGGIITESYATTTVSAGRGGGGQAVGGLVGVVAGTVQDCYARGNVSSLGNSATGGLVGFSYEGVIKRSYSTGVPSGSPHSAIGGFLGENEGGALAHGYWDTTTSGTATGVGQGSDSGVTGLTTEQFQSGLPKGFSTKVWTEDPNVNGGLPYLRAIPPK